MRYDITLSLGDYITIQKSDYITYISRFIRRNMWKMIKRKSIFKNSIIPSTIGTKAFRESDLNSEENHATFSCLKIIVKLCDCVTKVYIAKQKSI